MRRDRIGTGVRPIATLDCISPMPMLADLDDPPRSRVPGLLVGLLVSVPLVAVLVGWAIPTAIGSIVGGARDLDDRLRAKDAYLTVLCESGQDYERDAELCACVFSMEFPSLDCQHAFNLWALQRQTEACADPVASEQALSFCTCVQTVDEAVKAEPDESAKRQEAQRYENCEGLEDVLPLPEVEGVEQPIPIDQSSR